jgi:hypothetical protein
MRKKPNFKNAMSRLTFLILIITSLLTVSCSGKKNKVDKNNLIPEKELVSLLVDMHIADGLLSLPKINAWCSSLDSITAYFQVIEKHGYTRENLEKTLRYYFINNPKKLSKIYNQVLAILSEMETRVEKKLIPELARVSNLWTGKDFYSLPSLSGDDSTLFDITLNKPGNYTLAFSATLYPDDQSLDPRAVVYSCSPDSIETGKRRYTKSINYLKDGRPHHYTLTIPVIENKNLHLRGWLYNYNNNPSGLEKHLKIENISVIFSSKQL